MRPQPTTYTKHTTHTDALDTLGQIIDENEKRDAIHLAVEPCRAGARLYAGGHVTLTNGFAFAALTGEGVGIVDPFLTVAVEPGEYFWLVVYPRQISSLRHVWEHPDFPPSIDVALPMADSEKWLRQFFNDRDIIFYDDGYGPTFESTIERALSCDDEYLTMGTDAYGDIPDEFWDHVERFTGQKIRVRAKWFSCAC